MINNTVSSIEKISGQLKTLNNLRKFITLILYSAYLVYRIVQNNGYFVLNVVLLALTAIYAGFLIVYVSMDKTAIGKKTMRTVTKVYQWAKILFTGIGIGLNISSFLTVANQGMTVENLLFAIVMPAFLVLQILFDLLFAYAEFCFRILKEGVQNDIKIIKEKYEKPLQMVENVKNTITGIKTVKEGVSGLAEVFFNRKDKEKPKTNKILGLFKKKKKEEETKEIAASEEEPTVIDVEAHDVLPPAQEE